MNKKWIKALSLTLALGMTFSLGACNLGAGTGSSNDNSGDSTTSGGGSSVDLSNATELKVGVFNGGLGYEWASKLEVEFEERYKDVSFEPGKKGVDVVINPQKDLFKPTTIKTTIQQNSSPEDIYYTWGENFKDFAKDGIIVSMTDIVREKAYTADGEIADFTVDANGKVTYTNATKSIEDKMKDPYKDAFYLRNDQVSTVAEGYYALPYETSLSGFIYDHDLFVQEGWLHYSGINGLPGTMEEFYDLCKEIYDADMIPYISGPSNYWYSFTSSFIAQYEGEEAAKLTYTYDGEYTFPKAQAAKIKANVADIESREYITVNADGSYTATITAENAWLLAYMPSKEAYAEFCREITNPDYFDQNMRDTSYTFEKVQSVYVQSVLEQKGQKRIAMLFEGEWWENEARANFNYTGGYGVRDFRFMPTPKIEGQKTDGYSMGMESAGTSVFIASTSKKVDLCRLWLQFAHSEHALETFTLSNGAVRNAFDYDLSNEQLAQLSKFGQSVYKLKNGLDEYEDVKIYTACAYSDAHKFYDVCPMGGYAAEFGNQYLGNGFGSYQDSCVWGAFYGHAGDRGDTAWTVQYYMEGVYKYYSEKNWSGVYNGWAKNNQ